MSKQRIKFSYKTVPNRLTQSKIKAMTDKDQTALIALRLGRAAPEHYWNLLSSLFIASFIVERVKRHETATPYIVDALNALQTIGMRHNQRTAKDVFYSGTPEEIDRIEDGVGVYRGLLLATPAKMVLKCIIATDNHTTNLIEQAKCQTT